MRILEVTNYTAGGCGVGMRVLKESKLLSEKGHKVIVFSTNYKKGSREICPPTENVKGLIIKRFPAKKLPFAGESYNVWNFEKEAKEFKPDLIIAHSYRHPHTKQALKIAKDIGCKVFLVTHAPFARKNTRNPIQNIGVYLYDLFFGRNLLKKFDKIIAISKWEIPYLVKLGVSKNKIEYIPNGIDKEFFKPISLLSNSPRVIGYWGRISGIKQLESLNRALLFLLDTNYLVKIRGPAESSYLEDLKAEIKSTGLEEREEINAKSYDQSEQINGLESIDIFALPSKTEGMPQTLIEAMSRGKIVVASDNLASRDLIVDGKNGFIFENGNPKSLANLLRKIKNLNLSKLNLIQKGARQTAEKFKWDKILGKLEKIIR